MATKFSEKEMTDIRSKLKESAKKHSSSMGMRKTTVDDLCAQAGISKGAFYKFYDSKEALFFEILEDWHTQMYGGAREIMRDSHGLPDKERVYKALLYACRTLEDYSMIDFYENDMPLLLRKMPQEVLDSHYHSDEKHIADLIASLEIKLKASSDLAAATVRGLMLTLTHRIRIGPLYPQVLELYIRGVCDQLIE